MERGNKVLVKELTGYQRKDDGQDEVIPEKYITGIKWDMPPLLSTFLVLLLWKYITCGIADYDNFIVESKAKQGIIDAFHIVATTADYNKALQALEYSYKLHPSILSLYHIYSWRFLLDHKDIVLQNEKVPYDMHEDFDNYEYILYSDDVYALYTNGVDKHYEGDYDTAITLYNQGISLLSNYGITVSSPQYVNLLYHVGVSMQHLGDIENAARIYNRVLKLNPYHVKTRINLASLHHKYGNISTAITHYKIALLHCVHNETLLHNYITTERIIPQELRHKSDVYIMAKLNLGAAHFQLDQFYAAKVVLDEILTDLLSLYHLCTKNNHSQIGNSNYPHCTKFQIDYGGGLSHLLNLQRRTFDWNLYEERIETSINLSAYLLRSFHAGPILPFDSLLMDVSLQQRHDIAVQHSSLYTKKANKLHSVITTSDKTHTRFQIGFLSYDYSDHPTAHLIETIFHYIQYYKNHHCKHNSVICNVEVIGLSYGKDDNSDYRKSLINLVDQFYNISTYTAFESYQLIRQLNLDILLDLQCHTLGARLNILSMEPPVAPIIINYLVYPGTSGANFINYIIADYVVVPAEEQEYYTEKLIMLPPTYQIPSMYTSSDSRASKSALRHSLGLPTSLDSIILCNFNKIDKIDPTTFSAWMNIMEKVPNSYLWLLDPPKYNKGKNSEVSIVHDRINAICTLHGISSRRILYAPRVSKDEHVARHFAADLFLDTFVYGAHSTATDAIRGGLPVLTIHGNSFPNRVVSSIYQSYSDQKLKQLLITSSVKDFVDTACNLVLSRGNSKFYSTINHLSHDINDRSMDAGIFNNTNNVVKLFGSLYTVHSLENLSENRTNKYHLVYDV